MTFQWSANLVSLDQSKRVIFYGKFRWRVQITLDRLLSLVLGRKYGYDGQRSKNYDIYL